jgi:hypothetical protein
LIWFWEKVVVRKGGKKKRLVKVDKRLINEGKQIRVYDRKIIFCKVLSRSLQNLEVFK